jgi:hypothetical protein
MAMVRCQEDKASWGVVSDEPTGVTIFEASGLRVDIEAHFLDASSNGWPLESSWSRSAAAWERLCWVLARTTLSLVAQDPEVVQ